MARKRAFTLVEMLLVLAILVLLAAAALPALMGVLRDHRLQAAADQVRVEWTRGHVKAMKTGRIQVFRYELGGTKYTLQPWMATDDALEGAPLTPGFGTEEDDDASPRLDETAAQTLPEGITFMGGDAKVESRAVAIEQQIRDANRYETEWSRPILFYPDGSSSDAFLIVANERDVALQVSLRGMTGTTSIGEITAVEELVE